jgi:hypothetical protein
VSRFKKIQEQDPGDNEIFSKELGSATQKLQDKEHKALEQKFTKPSKRPQNKPEMPMHRGTSTSLKVNGKNGNLK